MNPVATNVSAIHTPVIAISDTVILFPADASLVLIILAYGSLKHSAGKLCSTDNQRQSAVIGVFGEGFDRIKVK